MEIVIPIDPLEQGLIFKQCLVKAIFTSEASKIEVDQR
jgi:hypothetical protein